MASTKQARGTKRTCQMSECGARFYDLNRNPITCPVCGSIYEIASNPAAAAAILAEEKSPRKVKKVEPAGDEEAATMEGDEALAEIESDDEPAAAEADETFLEEEEEDGGDMSGIIGGSVAEGEEEG